MDPDFIIDPERMAYDGSTGIYVRAVHPDGKWDSVDMATLTKESFKTFIESRGPVSEWAMSILFALMGHPREEQ